MTPSEFKKRRLQLGLTQKQMGSLLGKYWSHIQRYESGFTPIPKPVEIALYYVDKESIKKWLTLSQDAI